MQSIDLLECNFGGIPSWSPDGSALVITTEWRPCVRPGADTGFWTEILETESWSQIRLDPFEPTEFGTFPRWTDDGRLHVFSALEVRRYEEDFSGFESVEGVVGAGDVSPDGSMIATMSWPSGNDLALYDAASSAKIDRLPWDSLTRFPLGPTFSADGSLLAFPTEGGNVDLFDVDSGQLLVRLPSDGVDGVVFDESSGRIVTSHGDGVVRIWDPDGAAFGPRQLEDLGDASWVNGNAFVENGEVSAFFHGDIEGGVFAVSFFDHESGALMGRTLEFHNRETPLPTGEFALAPSDGLWVAYDPRTDEKRWFAGCLSEDLLNCDDPDAGELTIVVPSLDGSEVATIVFDEDVQGNWSMREWTTIDPRTLAQLGTELHEGLSFVSLYTDDWILGDTPDASWLAADRSTGEVLWTSNFQRGTTPELSPSRDRLLLMNPDEYMLVDLGTWETTTVAHGLGRTRSVAFSPDEERLVIGDEINISVLETETGRLLQQVPIEGTSDFHFFDDSTLLVATNAGGWFQLSLDTDGLLADARASIRDAFTDQECDVYRIDPCPSLEELRGG